MYWFRITDEDGNIIGYAQSENHYLALRSKGLDPWKLTRRQQDYAYRTTMVREEEVPAEVRG